MNSRELYINDVLCDLPDSSPVAITFQINDLADLADRQSTYTNAIKLPKTQTNCRALGYSNIDAFTQNEPYENNPCKYVENGVEVIPFGIAIIQQISDFFEVQLLYGVAGINDIYDDVSIKDMSFTDYNFPNTLTGIVNSQSATTGYLWPVIDVGDLTTASRIDIAYLRPAFFTKTIIQKLADYAGYTFTGNILYDTYFKKELITSLTSVQPALPDGKDLPDITAKDFLKDVMQRYFLTPEVDNYKKTLRFRSFDELYTNMPNAKDWTDKFLNDARTDVFALSGYAQRNKFNYKELEKLVTNSTGFIEVNNKTLGNEKTMVTSQFSVTDDKANVLGGLTVSFADLIQPDSTELKGANSRVLYDRKSNGAGLYEFYDTLFSNYSLDMSYPYFRADGLQGLQWPDLIQRYGQGLLKVLKKSRVVTRYVLLTELDVFNFDYFTPVFDRNDGKYYYVNQIVNWQPGKKTKVNLIRL